MASTEETSADNNNVPPSSGSNDDKKSSSSNSDKDSFYPFVVIYFVGHVFINGLKLVHIIQLVQYVKVAYHVKN
jgi:hypothetical protein